MLFLTVMRFHYEITCLWLQILRWGLGRRGWGIHMQRRGDSSWLWVKKSLPSILAIMSFPHKIVYFLLHNLRCVGRQKGLCGSSLSRVTSMHDIKSRRTYVWGWYNVTWTCILWCKEVHSGGCLGWWRECRSFEEWFCLLWAVTVLFDQMVLPSAFLLLRVDCACNRPSCLCYSVCECFRLQRSPQSVGRRERYRYVFK